MTLFPSQPSRMRRSFLGVLSVTLGGVTHASPIPETLDLISPLDFGAMGDGKTDDTAALQRAANQASKLRKPLIFPPGEYLLSDYVDLRSGVPEVRGAGGILLLTVASGPSGLRFNAGLTHCKVRAIKIRHLERSYTGRSVPIFARGVSDCEFADVEISGLHEGMGILIRSDANPSRAAANNVLLRCKIGGPMLETGSPRGVGIAIEGVRSFGRNFKSARERWRGEFRPPQVDVPASRNAIRSCEVVGCYYGIGLEAAEATEIVGNRVAMNVRNISIQNSSCKNRVHGNQLADSMSSSVHIAYGSCSNDIRDNTIVTRRARGEGLLQAYVGSKDNQFVGNVVQVTLGAEPKYLIYCGVQSSGNTFEKNTLRGKASRAFVAIESAFNSKSRSSLHRNFHSSSDEDFFASSGISGVRVVDNNLDCASAAPVFYIGEIEDSRGSYSVRDCSISRNSIKWLGDSLAVVFREATKEGISTIQFSANKFTPALKKTQFELPRGTDHFLPGTNLEAELTPDLKGTRPK